MNNCEWCSLPGETRECDCQERIYCKEPGEFGHYGCGWCRECQRPVWSCYHFFKRCNPNIRDQEFDKLRERFMELTNEA